MIPYLEKETTVVAFFCGLIDFCRKRLLLVSFTIGSLLFVYGVRLFNFNIGIDTDLYMGGQKYLNWKEIGRFGLVFLQKIWCINTFNLYAANFFALLFMLSAILVWCYLIDVFCQHKVPNMLYFVFAFAFSTDSVWAEQIYFTCQAAETIFIVLVCPISLYLLYSGLLFRKKSYWLISVCLLTFMVSVYQAIIMMFCCGVLICFILLKERTAAAEKEYWKLIGMIAISVLIALVCYFVANTLIKEYIFKVEKSDYLIELIGIKKKIFSDFFFDFLMYVYQLFFINNYFVSNRIDTFLLFIGTGKSWVNDLLILAHSNASGMGSNIAYFLSLVLYIILIFRKKNNSLISVLALVGIPLCIFVFPVLAGGGLGLGVRVQYVVPLAFSFIMFYVIKNCSLKTVPLLCAVFIFCTVFQAQTSAQLIASDQMRYQFDYKIAENIHTLISRTSKATESKPVLLYGAYQAPSTENYLLGQVLGQSCFHFYGTSIRGLAFMRAHGMNYYAPTDSKQIQKAMDAAAFMPNYPDEGCVKNCGDVIVVKLSD